MSDEYEVVVKRHPCPGLGFRYEVSLRCWYDRDAPVLGYIETEPWLCYFRSLGIRAARWQARRVHGFTGEVPVVEEEWK